MRRVARLTVRALSACVVLAVLAPAAQAGPGDLDGGFASGGIFTAPFMTTFPGAEDSQTIAVDSLGRVYLSATQEPQLNGGPVRAVKVVRLTPAGVPDPGFGTGGTVTLPTTGDVRNAGIVVDAQDRPVVLTNDGENVASWRIGLTRLTTVGDPDPTFDGDGVAESALPGTAAGWNTWPAGIALDKDGGILVVGTLIACSGGCTRKEGFVARFGSGGALDGGYGTGGWTAVGNSGTEMAAIQALPAGGAVVAGYDDAAEWVVARLAQTGAPDASFDGDGEARSDLGKQALESVSDYGLTVDAQGRPIVVGQLNTSTKGIATVARFTATGAPDPSFGPGTQATGVVLLPAPLGRGQDAAISCSDGGILVLAIGSAVELARLTDGGVLDTGFAANASTPGVAHSMSGTINHAGDLLSTGAGAYVAAFRRAQDNAVFTDYPQVLRFAAPASCGSTQPPATTPAAGTPPAATPPVTAAATKPAPALKVSDLVVFPGTRACVSRRNFRIRLRVPAGANVVSAEVRVNGKSVAVRKGARLRSVVDLRNLPKGRFAVKISLKLQSGKTLSDTRRYRTCAPKRRSR